MVRFESFDGNDIIDIILIQYVRELIPYDLLEHIHFYFVNFELAFQIG